MSVLVFVLLAFSLLKNFVLKVSNKSIYTGKPLILINQIIDVVSGIYSFSAFPFEVHQNKDFLNAKAPEDNGEAIDYSFCLRATAKKNHLGSANLTQEAPKRKHSEPLKISLNLNDCP